MREFEQASVFFDKLPEENKKELTEVIAEDIFFLDEELQLNVLALFSEVNDRLEADVRYRNNFTT